MGGEPFPQLGPGQVFPSADVDNDALSPLCNSPLADQVGKFQDRGSLHRLMAGNKGVIFIKVKHVGSLVRKSFKIAELYDS